MLCTEEEILNDNLMAKHKEIFSPRDNKTAEINWEEFSMHAWLKMLLEHRRRRAYVGGDLLWIIML